MLAAKVVELRQPTPEDARAKPVPLVWDDPLLMASLRTEEERMIRDTADAYCHDRLKPRAIEGNQHEIFDRREIMNEMGELGQLGPTTPEEYGCVGASYMTYGLIESDHGSDSGGMITRAVKVDCGFILTGAKNWISSSPIADVFIVWAKSDEHDGKINGFVIDKGSEGFTVPRIKGKFSLRASITGMIQMDGVLCRMRTYCSMRRGWPGRLAGSITRAMALTGARWVPRKPASTPSTPNTLDRKRFGKPLAVTRLIQKKLADMQTEISFGLLGSLRLGRMMDAYENSAELISLAKRNSCGKALSIARKARDQALILGRGITGLQAFQ